MRGTAGEEFREFVTARTPALLRYAHRLTGHGDAARLRGVVEEALAETWRHWRRARRHGPEEFARAAIERRARRRGVALPIEPVGGVSGGGPRPGDPDGAPGPETEIPPPADPIGPVLARARSQRRRRLAGLAVGTVIVLAGAGAAVALEEEHQLPPTPPAKTGLLPWPPRGDAADDPEFVRAATDAWRRHAGPGRPQGAVYVLYAGHPVEGRLALLQAKDAAGRPWVAQLHLQEADGRRWRVDQMQRLASTSVNAVVIDHGSRREPADLRRVQLLVAPRLTGVGISLLTRYTPMAPGRAWVYRQIRSDGLSGSWQQPPYPGFREAEAVFMFSLDDGPGTVVTAMGMVTADADPLPVDPPVWLRSGPWVTPSGPGEFTRRAAGWYDDGLAARAVLQREHLTVTPIVEEVLPAAPNSRPPLAALLHARFDDETWLVTLMHRSYTLMHRGSGLLCSSVQKLGDNGAPLTVVAGRCVPDEGPYPAVLLVATLDDVARVRYTAEAARPGERAHREAPPRTTFADPLRPRAATPTGRVTVVAYDADGQELSRWVIPPEADRPDMP